MMDRPKFIRPAQGFQIDFSQVATAYIAAECTENPDLERHWAALFARMKMTALREGEEIRPGYWTFVAEGAPKLSVPTLQVIFTHDHHTIYIKNAMVWQAGDENDEDDEDEFD